MSYNSQQKLRDNITALQIALTYEPDKVLTNGQVELLKKYSGFGGLKAVLFPNAPKEEWIKLKASKEDLKLCDGTAAEQPDLRRRPKQRFELPFDFRVRLRAMLQARELGAINALLDASLFPRQSIP